MPSLDCMRGRSPSQTPNAPASRSASSLALPSCGTPSRSPTILWRPPRPSGYALAFGQECAGVLAGYASRHSSWLDDKNETLKYSEDFGTPVREIWGSKRLRENFSNSALRLTLTLTCWIRKCSGMRMICLQLEMVSSLHCIGILH